MNVTITDTPLYGYTEQGIAPHYLRLGLTLTLCRRVVSYVPDVQPGQPDNACKWCVGGADRGRPYVVDAPFAREGEAICPDCEKKIPLDVLGLFIAHTVQRTKSGDVPCDGAGQAPEAAE